MNVKLTTSAGWHGVQVGDSAGEHFRYIKSDSPAHNFDDSADRKALEYLGIAMRGAGLPDPPESELNQNIPAGYTYLGQFISHDLSFNPVTQLSGAIDVRTIQNARTPSLDLDSVYGRGPTDQPYLYLEDGSLLTGMMLVEPDNGTSVGFDLPRQPAPVPWITPVRAIIADPRNDENRIVSQIHSLFMQFHNYLMKQHKDFQIARRLMRWHYQWIVLNDFLPRIVSAELLDTIMDLGSLRRGQRTKPPNFKLYYPGSSPWVPFEFAAATFQFGHSMVRPSYHISNGLKRIRDRHGEGSIPILAHESKESLRGRLPMQMDWAFDWDFFFPGKSTAILQPSLRIDTLISEPLFELSQAGIVDDKKGGLPGRTLLRGAQLGLPSGEDIARLIGKTPLNTVELYDEQVDDGRKARKIEGLDADTRKRLANRTPLWYYILREAEFLTNGERLGPVGGRIVAEVLVGLMFADDESFLNAEKPWQPDGSSETVHWGMSDLIKEIRSAPT